MAINLKKAKATETGFIYSEETPKLGEISKNKHVLVGRWGGDADEKIEIRSMIKDKETGELRPGKGIGLTVEEAQNLLDILQKALS